MLESLRGADHYLRHVDTVFDRVFGTETVPADHTSPQATS